MAANWILRRSALVLWVSALLTLLGGMFTVRLYGNLRTEIEEASSTSSRSVRDIDEVSRRLQSIDDLAILVFSQDTQASRRLVIDLAGKIEAFPANEVADVVYRIDRELSFFKKRQGLYMDIGDLGHIRDYVTHRINYEKELHNPLNIFSGQEIPEPELDFRALTNKYERRTKGYAHFRRVFRDSR